ncbi:GNAT family N-acetyltransferase [Nocardioides sp. zg-DK7169]|nr:GNAT family N-acetyltransferase [Nocardioides sp. zg-DK7169]
MARGIGGRDLPFRWWAVARDAEGVVVGAAMRTAPFAPYPPFVLAMPEEAALALARTLHARGEVVEQVNGTLPAARVVAEETARLAGGVARVHEHQRLFELGEVVLPPAPPGRLRRAEAGETDLVRAWFVAFDSDADEQAGRAPVPGGAAALTREELRARIEDGVVWLWEDEDGVPVHLTATTLPAHGVTRIGPVYTPKEHRGHGYARRAVAEVSADLQGRGERCCLFTDRANPVANALYPAIGYRQVAEVVELVVGPVAGAAQPR